MSRNRNNNINFEFKVEGPGMLGNMQLPEEEENNFDFYLNGKYKLKWAKQLQPFLHLKNVTFLMLQG